MEYKKFVMLVGALSTMTMAVQVEAAEFNDVPQKHWAFEEVHWLRADGMLEGWGGKFHGKRQFTRYEMAKVLGRYMGKYEAEKAKVEEQLGSLRQEDQQQRVRLDDLSGRTSALERRLGIQSPPAMASPAAVARSQPPVVVPVPTYDSSTPDPVRVTDDMIAGPPPSLVAPIETAPTVPVDEAESAAVERLATPDTQPPPRELPLSERIALMRQRLQEERQARPAPGGTGSGTGSDSSGSAPLPGMSSGTGDGGPSPAAPVPEGGLTDDELAARVQSALADLDSMPPLDSMQSAPPPTMESTSTQESSSSLSADQSGRYDAIRERYLRLMRGSGGGGGSAAAPPQTAPTPAPMLPRMTGSTSGASSSDFDFQPLPGEGDSQPLPGTSQPLPGAGSQPLPGMGAGSQPLPGSDDQPLPGMGASIDGAEDLELPDVGMPGLGYIEGTD